MGTGQMDCYRVRSAPNSLTLGPSDSDEAIFVGVKVERERRNVPAS
jgi:hypothetical protein